MAANEQRRIGIWCAVSSKPQASEEKESLPHQEELGRRFAAEHGKVTAIYRIPGHSRDLWRWEDAEQQMDAYRQLREDVEAGRLDVLWCLDSDRLGRDPALVQQVISLVERAGGEVYRANRPHQLGSKSISDRYLDAFDSVSAGAEKERIRYRHRMGMRGRVKRGLHPGNWPLGYSAVRNEVGKVVGAEFDHHADAVRFMTERFLAGDSYDAIVDALNASQYPPPERSKQWGYWHSYRTMNNDVYAGLVSWGGARAEEPSSRFPALWDPPTYAAILRERERRSVAYSHRGGGHFSGIAFCLRCGGPMVISRASNADYLRCSKHSNRRRAGWPCHPNYIKVTTVLDALAVWLEQFLDDATLDEEVTNHAPVALVQERDRLAGELERLGAKRMRVARAFADGDMTAEIYYRLDQELLDGLEAIASRLDKVTSTIEASPTPEERREALRHLSRDLHSLLHTVPARTVRAALIRAGVRIFVEDGDVQLIGHV